MPGYVDVHNHLIPGVDDGADTVEQSVELARGLARLGFEAVVTTPHVHPPRWDQSPDDLEARLDQVREALSGDGPRLAFGAENFLDDVVWRRFEEGSLILYPGGRAALVEFSSARPLPVRYDDRLFQMAVRGVTPVLAHPERYGEICDDLEVARRLVDGGTVLLVSITSFARGRLFNIHRRRAEALVRAGLVKAVATDLHVASELPFLEKGLRRLRKLVGQDELEALLVEGPRSFLEAP